MSKTCVFIGLFDFFNRETVEKRLKMEVENLILKGFTTFRMGNCADFDILSLHVCRKLREKYPHISIEVVYNCHASFLFENASFRKKYEEDVKKYYDDVMMKSYHVENVPLKFRLVANNRAMILDSDIVVCHYSHPVDEMHDYVRFARLLDKPTINIFRKSDLSI